MTEILNIINQPLSMGGMVLVAVLVLNVKVNGLEKIIDRLSQECSKRKDFCLKYFAKNNVKGGE